MRSNAACALSLALLCAAPGAGLSEESTGPLTLAGLMRRMADTAGVEARFREVRELGLLSAPLESRGLLYFVPPDRLARFTTEPVASALVVDGERVRFREGSGDAQALDVSGSPTARGFVEHFLVLFGGDQQRLEQVYRTGFSADGPRWTLALTPRRAPLSRFVESVTLRGDDRGLSEIALVDRDGDRTTTVFEETRLGRRFSSRELEQLFSEGLPLDAAASRP